MASNNGPLYDLSQQAVETVASFVPGVTVVSAGLNQIQWSDGKLHDIMDVGWTTTEFPGTFFLRVTATPEWVLTAATNIAYQLCAIEQIYVGGTTDEVCRVGAGDGVGVTPGPQAGL